MEQLAQQKRLEEHLSRFANDLDLRLPDGIPPDVEKVMREFHRRLFDPSLNVKGVLDTCGIKSHTFWYRFKFHCGCTPGQYYRALRVNAAVDPLLDDRSNIGMIAMALGYKNEYRLRDAFKAIMSCTPSAFRRQGEQRYVSVGILSESD